jgi:hypothetical protein
MKESLFFIVNRVSGAIMVNIIFDDLESAKSWLDDSMMNKKVVKIQGCQIKVKK